jgi:dihydrofolate reductase
MRIVSIIVDEIVSLDGFAARPGGAIDFFLDRRAVVETQSFPDRMHTVSDVLLGSVTYREFADYWPRQPADVPLNRLARHVVSTTLTAAPWGDHAPATVHGRGLRDAVHRVQESAAGDVIVWGSLSLARALFADGLVDELWLRVVPVTLGEGIAPFPASDVQLEQLGTTEHRQGFTASRYRVAV